MLVCGCVGLNPRPDGQVYTLAPACARLTILFSYFHADTHTFLTDLLFSGSVIDNSLYISALSAQFPARLKVTQ